MRIGLNLPKLAFCLCALALGLRGGIVRAQTFNLSGTVTDSTNGTVDGEIAVSGVSVTAVSAFGTNGPSVTSATGAYTISNLAPFFYTVTPAKTGLAFSPADQVVDLTSSTIAVDFSVAHSVSGNVSFNGTGLSGTTVTADGFSATTGTNGNYTINGVPWGTFAVVPSLSGYFFVPPSQNVPLGPNANGINFTAYPSGIYIGGQVTSGTNGVSGVTVTAGTNVTTTGSNGYYAFSNLLGVFLVTPSNAAQVFNPQHQTLTAAVGLTNINFAEGVSNITTIIATCDEPSLVTALALGGLVEFGTNGDLLITNTLTIATNLVLDGTNHQITLDGGGAVQIVNIPGSNTVVGLNNLVLANGSAYAANGTGGAIMNAGLLNIAGATFASNSASASYVIGQAEGGAIYNSGSLNLSNSYFMLNWASGGGGLDSFTSAGGAIYNGGKATILASTLAVNYASATAGTSVLGLPEPPYAYGGAIYNGTNLLVLVNCTFALNFLVLEDATDGYGAVDGAALYNSALITESNLYEGSIVLTNCTFVGGNSTAAVIGRESAATNINTFLRGCAFGSNNFQLFDNGTSFTDGGYNISLGPLGASNYFANATSRTNLDPMLGPLTNNGGPTMTFNLLPGSPCINAITNGSYPSTDQRGFPRPNGNGASIGAVEYYPIKITSLTRTNATNWNVAGTSWPLTTYQLLSSTNFTNWSVVQTNTAGSNGVFSSLDTSSNATQRFYLISVP
jgi:hypothetical protein